MNEKSSKNKHLIKDKYGFMSLSVGDCVFYKDPLGSQSKACKAARKWGSENGVKFVTRAMHGGVMMWRAS